MVSAYLYFNAFLYLLLSLWCLFKPTETAASLGYSFLNNNGKIEYTAVYAGMELGFAAFFAICGFYSQFKMAGLIFAVCMYTGLMLTRVFSALMLGGLSKTTYIIGGLELLLFVTGLVLLTGCMKKGL
jgi:hypothetical protein